MRRPKAYEGREPYIFVSYSHKDDARVWPVIEGLQARGMRVWYDQGIECGSHWDEEIFEHLSGCACVVAFITNNFLASENCKDEISYAKDERKGPFIVFLDKLELSGMMKYRYGRIQALSLPQFESLQSMLDTLCQTQTMACCMGGEQSFSSETYVSKEELEAWNSRGMECYQRQEYADAAKWFAKAARQGMSEAQFALGTCYDEGLGVAQDEEEAAKWYRKAADQGNAQAQYNLGRCYMEGQGVGQDPHKAVKWFRKAAQQGTVEAQEMLAYCYFSGTGVPEDKAEAVNWYREAALQGSAQAQYTMGALYSMGQGTAKDLEEAVKWFRKAAAQGRPDAQCALAYCYHRGEGIKQNMAKAIKLYRQAAQQGDAAAQHNLAVCYYNGEGVAKDMDEALRWLRLAARQGYEESQQALKDEGLTW